jgi:malic enzyme
MYGIFVSMYVSGIVFLVLPIILDVGTNNESLLSDPSYIGIREKRLQGKEYYDMVDEFLSAVFQRWPDVVVQFEDFETSKAVPLLQAYRNTYRIFNDDIQGTGCVTLSGIISAAKIAKTPITEMKILCAGGGSAGLGVCSQLVEGMIKAGLTREQAMDKFIICTVHGALGKDDNKFGSPHVKTNSLNENNRIWINNTVSDGESILEVIKKHKPNVLLGLTTKGGVFTEEIIKTMDSLCDRRPIIMPMSNPTSNAECTPENAYKWTKNRAIVATGSPFDPVVLPSGKELITSQVSLSFFLMLSTYHAFCSILFFIYFLFHCCYH